MIRPFVCISVIAFILCDLAFPAEGWSYDAIVYIAALVYVETAIYIGYTAAIVLGYVVGTVVVGAVLVGASMAMNALSGGAGAGQLPQDYSGSYFARGLLLNKSGTTEPIPLVYGSRRVGGCRVYMEVAGTSNEDLHLVLVVAEGPVSAINTVYLTEVASTDAKFTGYVDVYKHLGAADQAADAVLMAACPAWTENHKLSGVAYLHIRLKYSQDVFAGGLPTITADVDGKMVYDPRDTTTKFSRNPALCIRDYLTNTIYGRGIASSLIDDVSFIAAANYCEEHVTVGGVTQDRYTCDGAVNVDDTAMSNLDKMLTSCRGMLVFSGGLYTLIIDKPETPSELEFTEANITGSWTISLGNKKNMFNRLRARFFNPDRSWQEDIAVVDSTALRALDNGLILEKQVELPFTASINTARQIATINLNQSRQQIACSFTAFISGMRCEVGDVVPITHSTPAWTAKNFRIVGIALKGNDEVTVTAIEYDATVYDFGTISVVDATPNTYMSGPNDPVAPVIDVSHEEELYYYRGRSFTRWKVFFEPPAREDYPWWDHADIYLKIGESGGWKFIAMSGGNYQFDPVEEGITYYCRIVSVSIWGSKQVFEDGYTVSKTIEGNGAAPSNVTGFEVTASGNVVVFTANEVTDADVIGYEIRMGVSWAAGSFIGFNLSPKFRATYVTPGDQTFWIAAKNNAGLYSATPASDTATVPYPSNYDYKTEWEWDYSTGTHSNTEKVTHDADDHLKCSHGSSVLTGTWQSATYDFGEVKRMKIYGDFASHFHEGGKTWAGIFPTTWEAKAGLTWDYVLNTGYGGSLTAVLHYGESAWNENTINSFEAVAPEIDCRYIRVDITLTDPESDANMYNAPLNMTALTYT